MLGRIILREVLPDLAAIHHHHCQEVGLTPPTFDTQTFWVAGSCYWILENRKVEEDKKEKKPYISLTL